MQVPERRGGVADVGGVGLVEQAGPEDGRGQGEAGVVRAQVEGGRAHDVEQGRERQVVLAVPPQEPAQGLGVERGVRGVEALQGERAAHGPKPGRGRQHGVAQQGGREVRRRGQPRPPQPRLGAGRDGALVRARDDRDVEAALQRGRGGGVDPVEEPAVGRAAPQEDVLAVVDGELAAAERERLATQPRTRLEQRHGLAGVGQSQRGGGAGQTTAHHDDVHVRLAGDSAVSAIRSFVAPGNEARPVIIWRGLLANRVNSSR